ncbi:MAG TPA: GGDEF domain-containing protein [Miltoncostaea sp.]|nr:GGDEF domain-containing protein [Miltoncostaea sp.]
MLRAAPVDTDLVTPEVLGRVFEALEDGLVVRGAGGEIVAANAAARRLLRMAPGLAAPAGEPGAHRVTDGDGRVVWIDERTVPLGGTGVELTVLTDTTRQREGEDQLTQALAEMSTTYVELDLARDEIDRIARTDALTGAANRGHTAEALAGALGEGPLGVLLLDVDHFKRINDTHGHATGDAVLVEVVRRVTDAVRRGDLVGRWGGEEFLVLAREPGGAADLVRLAERVRSAIGAGPVAAGDAQVPVTVSIGVALAGTPAPTPDALVAAADAALYAAKDAGRDRVILAPAGA